MRISLPALLACAGMANAAAPAAAVIAPFHFSSVAEGQAAIVQQDGFFEAMGPYELTLRAAKLDRASRDEVRSQFHAGVTAWNAAARARVEASLTRIEARMAALKPLLPDRVDLVAVDASVEDNLPHTRGTAIFLPPVIGQVDDALLDFVMAHEIFHVLSRASTVERDRLYAVIGFRPCRFSPPQALAARHITNPDAPVDQHYVTIAGGDYVPYVFGPDAAVSAPLQLGESLATRLVAVRIEGDRCVPITDESGAPVLKKAAELPAFFDVVGKDSTYVSHPEELMADNFALWVTNPTKSKSPDKQIRIVTELTAAATGKTPAVSKR